MLQEQWKPIKGYERMYEISNFGRVKSLERYCRQNKIGVGGRLQKEKILKAGINSDGYLVVTLYSIKTKISTKVHCLVYDMFTNEFRDGHKLQVDHKDNNKLNNRFDNLQLLTNRQNVSKGYLFTKRNNLPTGVTQITKSNKYQAQITINNKNVYLGCFNTAQEASKVYQQKLKEIT